MIDTWPSDIEFYLLLRLCFVSYILISRNKPIFQPWPQKMTSKPVKLPELISFSSFFCIGVYISIEQLPASVYNILRNWQRTIEPFETFSLGMSDVNFLSVEPGIMNL